MANKESLNTKLTKRKISRKKLIALACVALVLLPVAYLYGGALVSAVVLNAPNVFFDDLIHQQMLSDRDVDDFSLEARVSDLKAVADAAGLERFAILAASSGGPITIA